MSKMGLYKWPHNWKEYSQMNFAYVKWNHARWKKEEDQQKAQSMEGRTDSCSPEIDKTQQRPRNLLRFERTLGGPRLRVQVDSDITGNLFSQDFCKKNGIYWRETSRIQTLHMAGGPPRHEEEQEVNFYKLQIDEFKCQPTFEVRKLGQRDAILGIPWLREFNPKIDWATHTLQIKDGPGIWKLVQWQRAFCKAARFQASYNWKEYTRRLEACSIRLDIQDAGCEAGPAFMMASALRKRTMQWRAAARMEAISLPLALQWYEPERGKTSRNHVPSGCETICRSAKRIYYQACQEKRHKLKNVLSSTTDFYYDEAGRNNDMMMAIADHQGCKTPTRSRKRHKPRTTNINETSEGVPRWCHKDVINPKDDLYTGAVQCDDQEKSWRMLHDDMGPNLRVHNSPEDHKMTSIRCHDSHLEKASGKHCHPTRSRRSLSCAHEAASRASSEESCIGTSKYDEAEFRTPKEHSFRTCFSDEKTDHVMEKEKNCIKRRPVSSATRASQDDTTTILRQALHQAVASQQQAWWKEVLQNYKMATGIRYQKVGSNGATDTPWLEDSNAVKIKNDLFATNRRRSAQCRFALAQTMRISKARTELHDHRQPRLQIHGRIPEGAVATNCRSIYNCRQPIICKLMELV